MDGRRAGTAALAEKLLADTVVKHDIDRDQLTIHADNGSSMTSKPVAFLLADLGVTKTHSRSHTSNDNPYSEAHFRTLKYRPDFPDTVGSLEDARAHCQRFFTWYNTEHYHSGIGYHHPVDVHYGHAKAVQTARADVLTAAYARNPERFVRKHPEPPALPDAAWINKPTDHDEPQEQPVSCKAAPEDLPPSLMQLRSNSITYIPTTPLRSWQTGFDEFRLFCPNCRRNSATSARSSVTTALSSPTICRNPPFSATRSS